MVDSSRTNRSILEEGAETAVSTPTTNINSVQESSRERRSYAAHVATLIQDMCTSYLLGKHAIPGVNEIIDYLFK